MADLPGGLEIIVGWAAVIGFIWGLWRYGWGSDSDEHPCEGGKGCWCRERLIPPTTRKGGRR